MRFRTPCAALAVASLALAACGADDDSATTDPVVTDDVAPGDDDAPGGDEPPDEGPAVGGDDVPDGVAASVGTNEITIDTVEGIFDEIAGSAAIAPQIESDEAGVVEPTLRAQVLSQLVVQQIIEDAAADDFGIEVSEADLESSLAQVESETEAQGGLDAALEAAGLTRDAFISLELPLIALLDELEAEFGEFEPAPGADPGTETEGQMELQQWGSEKFLTADVSVSPDYGTWDPVSGQVQPAGLPEMPMPGPDDAPPPEFDPDPADE